jgi:hypothetical protein
MNRIKIRIENCFGKESLHYFIRWTPSRPILLISTDLHCRAGGPLGCLRQLNDPRERQRSHDAVAKVERTRPSSNMQNSNIILAFSYYVHFYVTAMAFMKLINSTCSSSSDPIYTVLLPFHNFS